MSTATLTQIARAFGLFEPDVTLSGDGRLLAWVSYSDNSRHGSIFLRDLITGTARMLNSGVADSENSEPALAANGSTLAFTTVAQDWSGVEQIAVMDLASGSIRYASTTSAGAAANGDSRFASISASGRYVAFDSDASNLASGDSNGASDVFVKDMLTGAVQRVSVDTAGAQLPGGASGARMSADGHVVLFRSVDAMIPGAAPSPSPQLYAKNLATGQLTLVSANAAGQASDVVDDSAALSADGRYVVFSSLAHLAGDMNDNYDVFRKDLLSGVVELVSSSSASVQGAGWAADPSMSADGRYVSFAYDAADLNGGPRSSLSQVYVKDMQTGALTQVSQGTAVGEGAFASAFSGDGAHLAYVSYAGIDGAAFDINWNVVVASVGAPVLATPSTPSGAVAGTLVSTVGNDVLVGAGLLDTAVYHGNMGDYDIRLSGAGNALVGDRGAGRDGSDTLHGIERLQFSDGMVALDSMGPSGVAGQAYRIYQAAFDRVPDLGGLGYWIAAMDHGQSLQGVAAGFARSGEFEALYGKSATNAHVVDTLYLNVLHRAGEPAGVAYWNGVLDKGNGSVADVLAAFSESAENVAALVGVLEHGFAYTPFG